jgi:hypothetical protein
MMTQDDKMWDKQKHLIVAPLKYFISRFSKLVETDGTQFSIDSSCLRLPKGEIVGRIQTDLGNGNDFDLVCITETKISYIQLGGCISLHIIK